MKKEVKVSGEEVKEEKDPDENWEKIKEEKMIKAWNLIGWRKYEWVWCHLSIGGVDFSS